LSVGTSKGNSFVNASARLPDYSLSLKCKKIKMDTLKVEVNIFLANIEDLKKGKTAGPKHSALLLVADKSCNKLIYSEKIL